MNQKLAELAADAKRAWNSVMNSAKPLIMVGTATCGRSAGGGETLAAIKEEIGNRRMAAEIIEVGCLGMCYAEPLIHVKKPGGPAVCYGEVGPERAAEIIEEYIEKDNPLPQYALGTLGVGAIRGIPALHETPVMKLQARRVLRHCGWIDPSEIKHYLADGGYGGFVRAVEMGSGGVIDELKAAGLRGRGGAGFPTWRKWQFCIDAPGAKKYIVCNADEGDPGAFMNRSLLEGDPHSVIEGMLIAGCAIGAEEGYIYCRAEYPLALERLDVALKQAHDCGILGDDVLGTGFKFHVKVKEGAGAFVCGEETALIASIEGKRGMPRSRPPFPAASGLWGRPTVINNVETLASVSMILQKGATWFAEHGTEKSKGTKTFALVGKVKRTGLVEVPLGITLREMIFDVGGGVLNDRALKAVQTGGPSGGCIPASLMDLSVDYDSLNEVGSIMGSGGMVVMDEDTCMVDFARYFLDFTQKESCGKCVPCRLGTKQMLDMLNDIAAGKGTPEDIRLLEETAMTVKKTSLCGLGQTAPNPVLTSLRYFRNEYEQHVNDRQCRSLVCKKLISYRIAPEKCRGCHVCVKACPEGAISGEKKSPQTIDQAKCVRCGVCVEKCPPKFAAIECVPGVLENAAEGRNA